MALGLAALAHHVAGIQQKAGDDQRHTDEHHVAAQVLHRITDGQHGEEGQRGKDDQQDHAPGRRHRRGRGAPHQISRTTEELADDVRNVLPVGHEHRQQRTQMQQHVIELRHLRLQVQKVLGNGQMAGAGNGQKLRNALNEAQQKSRQIGHSDTPLSFFDYDRSNSSEIFLFVSADRSIGMFIIS